MPSMKLIVACVALNFHGATSAAVHASDGQHLLRREPDGMHHSSFSDGTHATSLAELTSHQGGSNHGEERALGLMIIDYKYPTQPGDVDDKRSFCTMRPGNYSCIDSFSLVKSKVVGLTFEKCQENLWDDQIKRSFENALKALLMNPRVKAITANCGFFAHYQSKAEDYMADLVMQTQNTAYYKPIRLSTLSLIRRLVNAPDQGGWGLQQQHEKTLVVTANKMTLNPRMMDLVKKLKVNLDQKKDNATITDTLANATHENGSQNISQEMAGGCPNATQDNDDVQRTVQLGAELTPGFGLALATGRAHNVLNASGFLEEEVLAVIDNNTKRNTPITHIIFECAELPAYANRIRLATNLPVWDIVTLGTCLMRSQLTDPIQNHEDVGLKNSYKMCMVEEGANLESRFGTQVEYTPSTLTLDNNSNSSNGTVKGYASNGTDLQGQVRNESDFVSELWALPPGTFTLMQQ